MESTEQNEQKRRPGRPSKYEGISLVQLETLAGFGLTDAEMSLAIGVSIQTFNTYKENPEFFESLKRGKLKADQRVIKSLYKRATGYNHKDIYFSQYEGTVTATPYKKHYAPDVTAQIFWLKNRRPQEWRDRVEFNHTGTIKFESVDVTKLGPDKLDRIISGENPELVLADARN